ncbi:MAG: helix-turn-helix domain-containing protein [Gemmatimonadales bacterium]
MGRTTPHLPSPVVEALQKLGSDIRKARLRRRMQMAEVADLALISYPTLHKVERGDPGVSLGIYASVLCVLGWTDRLKDLADVSKDPFGIALEEQRLPKRIRHSRTEPKEGFDA